MGAAPRWQLGPTYTLLHEDHGCAGIVLCAKYLVLDTSVAWCPLAAWRSAVQWLFALCFACTGSLFVFAVFPSSAAAECDTHLVSNV